MAERPRRLLYKDEKESIFKLVVYWLDSGYAKPYYSKDFENERNESTRGKDFTTFYGYKGLEKFVQNLFEQKKIETADLYANRLFQKPWLTGWRKGNRIYEQPNKN